MISSSFNEKLEVLEVEYKGHVSLTDLLEYGDSISFNDTNYPTDLKILTDARNVEYKIDPDDIHKVVAAMKRNLSKYKTIKNAFIYSTPRETAISLLLEGDADFSNYFHKIFSTKKAALNWLLKN